MRSRRTARWSCWRRTVSTNRWAACRWAKRRARRRRFSAATCTCGPKRRWHACRPASDAMTVDAASRRRMEGLEREALQRHQLARFNELLDRILPHNTFYARKFAHITRPVDSLAAFRELPFTTKEDLVATDSAQGLAAN